MEVQLYIKGNKIDLFEDEKISINLSVKNINDLSKVFTDFTQTFTIPCTKNNNAVFEHWYNADVDGTFNVNIRVEAYIEVNTLPYRYGTVQLDNAKMKDGQPYAYSCTFYGASVNLMDLFGEEELKDLTSLAEFNHDYNATNVINAMTLDNLFNGDLYYPMINAVNEMSLETVNTRDLENASNTISYREFKPALREIKIIEAIEQKYGVTFSRDFFDRAVFYNLFLWLHKDAGYLKSYGNEERVDLQSLGNLSDIQIDADLTENTLTFIPVETSAGTTIKRDFKVRIYPEAGYENIPYKLRIYRNDVVINEGEFFGNALLNWNEQSNLDFVESNTFYMTISAQASFEYTSEVNAKKATTVFSPYSLTIVDKTASNTTPVSILSSIKILDQLPEIKVVDYIVSLINKFNLVIVPTSTTNFYIDTLDNWYSKGRVYDLNKYIDIKDIEVKRPNVKKKIEFLYQKTDFILGKQYFENNQESYGDLKATYNISGDELKIETQFDNMLFERLQRESSGELTELQVGFAIDKNLNPTKGKPIRFYRNGIELLEDNTYIQPSTLKTEYWHTATEDNKNITQVTNSLNFGSDISSYFYTSITNSLYYNWWRTYIEDLFNRKCRVLSIKGKMPTHILYKLKMNDKFIIQDRRYKISDLKIDLTTGSFSGEVFTDFSSPADTIDNLIPLTVDSTLITVDSELVSVDATSTYESILSFTTNGISITDYTATKGEENFEVKVTSNTNWGVEKIDTGDGVSWFNVNKLTGNKTDYVRVKINYSTINRTGILRFTIGTDTFDLNIIQS